MSKCKHDWHFSIDKTDEIFCSNCDREGFSIDIANEQQKRIEELEKKIAELESKLELMKKKVCGICHFCKYHKEDGDLDELYICYDCMKEKDKWEFNENIFKEKQ